MNRLANRMPPQGIKSRPLRCLRVSLVLGCLTLFSTPVQATNHFVHISEVMAGLNGDSRIQFFEMVADEDQKQWGPGFAEDVGRVRLVFFDTAGKQTGRFVVPSDPGFGKGTVLFATEAFAALTGITPDFIIPAGLIQPHGGKVCFKDNADNDSGGPFPVNLCLSYGGSDFTGDVEFAGDAHPHKLPIMNAESLGRVRNFITGDTQRNADFARSTPTPAGVNSPGDERDVEQNVRGQVMLPLAASVTQQGETLFSLETFHGNGRTCATCHKTDESFGLSPATVDALPGTDSLFVHELNINTLVVNSAGSVKPDAPSGFTQPSDFLLGDTIRGSAGGSAKVLAGSGSTYLIIGGRDLDIPGNLISDSHGNRGTLVSFTPGNLDGPAPNGDVRGLEDSASLRGGRALITENINGFDEFAFLRGSPTLLHLKHTAPFGLSGEIPDLQAFTEGAVSQHLTRDLNRVEGRDFRPPSSDELDAMTAFMETIGAPAAGDFDEANQFDRFVVTEAQRRGRDLFFGSAKCGVCHNGKVLATSDGQFGTTQGGNERFNTGVATLAINTDDDLPTEQNVGEAANSRAFSTPPLFGVRDTAPFFHDNAKATLLEAIEFYDSRAFRQSLAFAQVGPINDVSIPSRARDIQAFLEALSDRVDLDGDGDVDRDDLNILIADRGSSVAESACGAACDLDRDGRISALDARRLQQLCTRRRCATE